MKTRKIVLSIFIMSFLWCVTGCDIKPLNDESQPIIEPEIVSIIDNETFDEPSQSITSSTIASSKSKDTDQSSTTNNNSSLKNSDSDIRNNDTKSDISSQVESQTTQSEYVSEITTIEQEEPTTIVYEYITDDTVDINDDSYTDDTFEYSEPEPTYSFTSEPYETFIIQVYRYLPDNSIYTLDGQNWTEDGMVGNAWMHPEAMQSHIFNGYLVEEFYEASIYSDIYKYRIGENGLNLLFDESITAKCYRVDNGKFLFPYGGIETDAFGSEISYTSVSDIERRAAEYGAVLTEYKIVPGTPLYNELKYLQDMSTN